MQNDISSKYFESSDLAQREQEVLKDASQKTGFKPVKLISRSAWWGSAAIGAFHFEGVFRGKGAVLKIQGIKPNISEVSMIKSFTKANKSKIIRPPRFYAFLPWDKKKKYEALIMESIDGEKIIQTPTTKTQVKRFFKLYKNYRANCLQSPWLNKPKETIPAIIVDSFKRWRKISFKIYPSHLLRKSEDQDLIDAAVEKLRVGYLCVEPEFMHGHFSENDLYQAGQQVVIFSNLYWSWRPPLYDAVFGYHWFIYHLNTVEGITPAQVEAQRNIWLGEIEGLPRAKSKEGKKLLNLALLERAAAGLNLDGLSADPKKPISDYLMGATRSQLKKLLGKV